MNLNTPIGQIPRIGPASQKKLARLGIKTVQDLLWYFPSRYEDFSSIRPIAEVKLNEKCCIAGKILDIKTQRTWKRKMFITEALIQDDSGAIKAVWFNQPYLTKTLQSGDNVCVAGKAAFGNKGLFLSSPAYEKIYSEKALTHLGRIVPVYPETIGVSSRWLRWLIKPLLEKMRGQIPETLPLFIAKQEKLLPINEALWQIHFPDSLQKAEKAKERFAFEELFFIELFVLRERAKLAKVKGRPIPLNVGLMQKFVASLPFKLTNAQRKSAWQILKDLERARPMNRLLEGDVGSGKTVVAAMAALNTIKAGFQVAFMAPTEILAKQHFQEVAKLLAPFNLNTGLLTGKADKFFSKKLKRETIEISRTKLLEKAKKAEMDILIGTHALIQDKVKFGQLALVILDEQHRFGVEQRAKLCQQKEFVPHLLSMTATPIPRTLALTVYGDLDLSLIDELPKGRKKIITKIVAPADRDKAYEFIRKQVKKGRQVFVICPRIEGQSSNGDEARIVKSLTSNVTTKRNGARNRSTLNAKRLLGWAEAKAVKEEYEKLAKEVFPDLKVGMLHGKLASKEKENVMKDFKNKKIDILVSTSVIEVGIDVPNATVMLIEGTERFGLAQLYQFRGRVGRARYQSYCFLFTDSPARKTHQRLKALINAESGFELAEKDLAIRGPGDFAGTRQWGIPDLVMASLTDLALVEKTREAAKELLMADPQLKQYPLLARKLERFEERVHLE